MLVLRNIPYVPLPERGPAPARDALDSLVENVNIAAADAPCYNTFAQPESNHDPIASPKKPSRRHSPSERKQPQQQQQQQQQHTSSSTSKKSKRKAVSRSTLSRAWRFVKHTLFGGLSEEEEEDEKIHPKHHLDIYLPYTEDNIPPPGTKYPVLIHTHGGGWQRGDKSNEWRGGPVAGRFAAQNQMIAVVINYRLAPVGLFSIFVRSSILSLLLAGIAKLIPAAPFVDTSYGIIFAICFGAIATLSSLHAWFRAATRHPTQVLDVASAIAWTHRRLESVVPMADMNKVFLSGHSAGAHLVSLVTLDRQYLDAVDVPADFIKGVISVSGIYTVRKPLADEDHHYKNRFFRLAYTNAAFGWDADVLHQASPISHIPKAAERFRSGSFVPPFLILHATSDMGLDVDARRFYAQMAAVGLPASIHEVLNTSHSTIASKFGNHEAGKLTLTFIQDIIKKCEEKNASSSSVRNSFNVSPVVPTASAQLSD